MPEPPYGEDMTAPTLPHRPGALAAGRVTGCLPRPEAVDAWLATGQTLKRLGLVGDFEAALRKWGAGWAVFLVVPRD